MDHSRILIIGGGHMGFTLAQAASRTHSVTIVEPEFKYHARIEALNGVLAARTLAEALENSPFDLIVLATPTKEFPNICKELAQNQPKECVITDISSVVKSGPTALVHDAFLAAGRQDMVHRYVPCNPQSVSRHERAEGKLFQYPVLVCKDYADPDAVFTVTEFWQSIGAETILMPSVKAHDELATIGWLWPNVMSFALQLFSSGYDLQSGCENAQHNPDIISEDNLLRLARNMNVPPERQLANMTRWERFLNDHHLELQNVICETARKLREPRRQINVGDDKLIGIVEQIVMITAQMIDDFATRMQAETGATYNLKDLWNTTAFRHQTKAVDNMGQSTFVGLNRTAAPGSAEAFINFLDAFAKEFSNPERALMHVQSAFLLFNGMRGKHPVTIRPQVSDNGPKP